MRSCDEKTRTLSWEGVASALKKRRFLRTPSPAMVVACIGLSVALGGTGYAVTALPRNSVGTAQLKANAVNSAKVKDRSLKAKDFALGQIPAGPAGPQGERGPEGPPNPNALNSDRLDNLDSSDFLRSNGKAADANALDGIDAAGFVQGRGKTYVGRIVLPTSSPFPNDVVLTVPGFATLRALNCQAGGANASLSSFQQTRGTFSMWRDTGDADPGWFMSAGALSWGSNFQVTERTTWHLSVGTGATAEAAVIDLFTRVEGSNCYFSAVAQVWGS